MTLAIKAANKRVNSLALLGHPVIIGAADRLPAESAVGSRARQVVIAGSGGIEVVYQDVAA